MATDSPAPDATPIAEPSFPGGRTALLLALVLAATALVYLRALGGELVYDDRLLIARNPLIADLGNLPRLFVSGYWDFLAQQQAEHIGYWRPLTAILQALVWAVGGSAPLPYHALCVLVHLGATAAAFFLARGLSGRLWIAVATSLLFGLHPAHVESVAWISALNDPLFGALTLLALERFLAWRRAGSIGIPWMGATAFALALLSKEMGAALLPLLLLFDLLRAPGTAEPGERLGPFSLPACIKRAYAPFGIVLGLYLVARMVVFSSPLAGFDRVTTDFAVDSLRLVLLRIELLGGSLEILALPIHLNLFRPFRPHLSLLDPDLIRAAIFGAVFAALVVAAYRRRNRLFLAALLTIPAGLLPALIRVESLGVFPLSERFLYLPIFGFSLALALGLDRLRSARFASGSVLVLAALYGARSASRIGFWHDEETLFRTAAADSPRSVYVKWSLGRVLLERASSARDPRILQEAFQVFEQAQDLLIEARQPETDLMVSSRDYLQANLGLAWCYINESGFEAEGGASTAVALLEDLARRVEDLQEEKRAAKELGIRVRDQYLDLDLVYTALGVARTKNGDFAEAERAFQRALELQPSTPETHQNLGRLYARTGRWEEARAEFETASRSRPGNPEDRLLLAQALVTLGQAEQASALAHALLDEIPERSEPLVALATLALERQDSAQALSWLQRALAIDPRNSLIWYQKARAHLARNEERDAVTAFRNAIDLGPTHFEAFYDFAAYLLSTGVQAEARPLLVRAYSLSPTGHRPALRDTLTRMPGGSIEEFAALAAVDGARGDVESALGWVERALEEQPSNPSLRLDQAQFLGRLGRDTEALDILRDLSRERPTDYVVWSQYAAFLHAHEGLDAARAVLEQALELDPPGAWPADLRANSRAGLEALLSGKRPEIVVPDPGAKR